MIVACIKPEIFYVRQDAIEPIFVEFYKNMSRIAAAKLGHGLTRPPITLTCQLNYVSLMHQSILNEKSNVNTENIGMQ